MQRKPVRKSKSRRRKGTGKSRPKAHDKARERVAISRPDSVGALVEAAAQALGIPLNPAWHEAIAFNLRLILRHAKLVDEFPLPDYIEPAPVFYA
jgi:hypothetical protein